jgi:hypothetical protein
MPRSVPVSFRIPSKYIVFLDIYAEEKRMNRTQALIEMLDCVLNAYLKAKKDGKL